MIDTGIFDDERYFDVFVEYAKADADDILIRLTIINRGPEEATLDLLPTLWFRNTWSWTPDAECPSLHRNEHASTPETTIVQVEHPSYGQHWLSCEGTPPLLFTENETNTQRLYGCSKSLHRMLKIAFTIILWVGNRGPLILRKKEQRLLSTIISHLRQEIKNVSPSSLE